MRKSLKSKDSEVENKSQNDIEGILIKKNVSRQIRKAILPWIIFGLLFCLGIVFLIYSGVRKEFRHNNWVATQAVVVNQEVKEIIDKENKGEYNRYYHAVFQYFYEGAEYILADKTGGSSPVYSVGDTVTIYVNPSNPEEFESQATTQFFYIFGSIMLVISFCALCFTTSPVLDAAFPKSDLPQYIGRYLPTAIFVWTVTVISLLMIKPHSVLNMGALIVFIIAFALSLFLTVIMIISIFKDVSRRKRIAKQIAKIDRILQGCDEFKKQHPDYFSDKPNKKL